LIGFDGSALTRGPQQWPTHLHHFFQLDVLLDGAIMVDVEGCEPFQARGGDGWLIPPLVRHGFRQQGDSQLVSFKLQLAPVYFSAARCHWRCVQFPDYLQQMLMREGQDSTAMARLVAMASLCVLEVLAEEAKESEPDWALDSFRQALWPLLLRVEQEPQAGWSVAQMAEACYLSVDHFSKCFQIYVEQTPRQYLLNVRMRAAAVALVNEPHRAIKEIAQASGYATVHAFSAAFKRVFERSPADYRRTQSLM